MFVRRSASIGCSPSGCGPRSSSANLKGAVIILDLRDARPDDLTSVAAWIDSARDCERWAGPRVPYPLDLDALPQQIAMAEALNIALVDERGLAGFGQALSRGPGRAHLTRVIVRPNVRGSGLGRVLCQALLDRSAAAGLTLATLYVYRDNPAAARLYASLGFKQAECPAGEQPSAETVFMQRTLLPTARAETRCRS
jgi:[ribosomal protein S18]-alanine N-acetyltransferase